MIHCFNYSITSPRRKCFNKPCSWLHKSFENQSHSGLCLMQFFKAHFNRENTLLVICRLSVLWMRLRWCGYQCRLLGRMSLLWSRLRRFFFFFFCEDFVIPELLPHSVKTFMQLELSWWEWISIWFPVVDFLLYTQLLARRLLGYFPAKPHD